MMSIIVLLMIVCVVFGFVVVFDGDFMCVSRNLDVNSCSVVNFIVVVSVYVCV